MSTFALGIGIRFSGGNLQLGPWPTLHTCTHAHMPCAVPWLGQEVALTLMQDFLCSQHPQHDVFPSIREPWDSLQLVTLVPLFSSWCCSDWFCCNTVPQGCADSRGLCLPGLLAHISIKVQAELGSYWPVGDASGCIPASGVYCLALS